MVTIPETEVFKQTSVKSLKIPSEQEKTVTDSCMKEVINKTASYMINKAYLNEPGDGKITPIEMNETQFAASIVKTMRYYFPDWNFDHPVVMLVFSIPAVLTLMSDKKSKRNATPNNAPAV
jgi:hypothetical protein